MLRLNRLVALVGLIALPAIVPARARADRAFEQGPYLVDPHADSVVVMAMTPSPVPVTVRASFGSTLRTFEGPRGNRHAVRIEGFAPGDVVRYELRAPGYAPATGTYRAPVPVGGGPIDVLVLGDCRSGDAPHARIVRRLLHEPGDFVLFLGDMVPTGRTVEEWTNFLAIERPIFRDRPLVPVLGNHEIAIGELGRRHYDEHVRSPGASPNATFYAYDHGPARFLVLDSNTSLEPGSPQRRFLEAEAARADAAPVPAVVFAAVHHGPYASGYHRENAALHAPAIVELLRRAHVSLVFSGHDHTYERGEADGIKYVVTGGAGSPLYAVNHAEPYQLAFVPDYHYVALHVDGPHVRMRVVRANGRPIETCSFDVGGPWRCPDGPRGPIGGEPPWLFYGTYPLRQKPLFGVFAAMLLLVLAWAARKWFRRA